MGNLDNGVNSFLDLIGALEEEQRKGSSVALQSIVIPKSQPRRYFDPHKLEELKRSIQEHGILEPLIVRPLKQPDKYELVAGERRYRAAKDLGLEEVPVTIRELTDNQALQIALIENLQREDLNPVEETKGILKLLALELDIPEEEVKSLLYHMSNNNPEVKNNVVPNSVKVVQEVFASIGKISWESFTKHRLGLLNIAPELLQAVESGKIEYTKAKAIARVKDESQRKSLLENAIAEQLSLGEIRKRIDQIKVAGLQDKKGLADRDSYQKRFKDIQTRIKKVLWSDPAQKKEFETLLVKLENMITPDENVKSKKKKSEVRSQKSE
ncbi:MAG: ParB/RepB/Spo0J family partition protein [Brasilonema octagenarum HA4186-MV1]|jgi:ParB family chromosome partitioning protein|nr:ParB/RepB/Spo0J family partition protein [Brasilonema octagenarum HA4186-MV1]